MPEIDLIEVELIDDAYQVYGTVDGAGYRISVPKETIDAAPSVALKQRRLAEALRDETKIKGTRQPAFRGKVTL